MQQLLIDLASATVMPRGTRPPMPSGGAVERLNREQLGARAAQQLPSLGQTDVAAAYFLQHAVCSDLGIAPEAVEISEAMRRVPLVAYRIVSCGRVDGEALDTLLAAEPRLVELHYFKATAAFVAGALLTTERELRVFDERFPAAPASALLRGQVLLALEEFEAAAAAFDVVLATDADQPEALLYRMRAVSQLGDAARGEAAADRLVTLGTWYQGEAYYWRAWNRRALGQLGEAASDIETAKRVLFNAAVPKLAGFIAFDRQQLDLALTELTTSRERNGNDCEVIFAIGQVHARRSRWAEAAESFTATIGCTQAAQAAARTRMDEIAGSRLGPAASRPSPGPRRTRPRHRARPRRACDVQCRNRTRAGGPRRPRAAPGRAGPGLATMGGEGTGAARRAAGTPELKFRPTYLRRPASGIRSDPCNWSDRFRPPSPPGVGDARRPSSVVIETAPGDTRERRIAAMKAYDSGNIRNVAVVGHGGAGKTQLIAALLYTAGATPRLGRVDDGTTVTDNDDEEIARKHTLSASLAWAEWNKTKINFIDTPGMGNFLSDARAGLRIADAALVVVDAVAGVEVQTEKVWAEAEALGLPRLVVVNRLDRERSSLDRTLASIREVLSRTVVPVQLPLGEERGLSGVIDLVGMKAWTFATDGSGKATEGQVPFELTEVAGTAREQLIEMVAEADDALMERFFEAGTLTQEELLDGLRKAVLSGKVAPLLCTSGLAAIGTSTLLDALVGYVPSPTDRSFTAIDTKSKTEVARTPASTDPYTAFVWKTVADPFAGRITLFRVMTGTLKADSSVHNLTRDTSERIGHLTVMQGKTPTDVPSSGPATSARSRN